MSRLDFFLPAQTVVKAPRFATSDRRVWKLAEFLVTEDNDMEDTDNAAIEDILSK